MGLKDFLSYSSNDTYERNMELLEDHDLVNVLGSPNKLFLKYLGSRNLNIRDDEITEDIIADFEGSLDYIARNVNRSERRKELIFKQRKVWINLIENGENIGSDLLLDHVGILIEKTNTKILYSEITDIDISNGGWSKKRFDIFTSGGEVSFTVNENYAEPLKEILEDNIENERHDEIDDLIDLHEQFENGEISEEEYELRKALIYDDDNYCTQCGAEIDVDSRYCENCGNKIR